MTDTGSDRGRRSNAVLFETNVWKFFVDDRACKPVRLALRQAGLKGVVSPLVVDELVRPHTLLLEAP